MDIIKELILRELERPRTLPAQVGRHLNATYGIGLDEVGSFFERGLDALEDYEIDLILSPVFTPTLPDQAIFATALGGTALAPETVTDLISQIAARPTVAQLAGDDGVARPLPLREVTVERYVRRLRLAGSIPDELVRAIERITTDDARPTFLAAARRAVWSSQPRQELLAAYLRGLETGQGGQGTAIEALRTQDLLNLLRLVETYEPAGLTDFLARLPGWIEAVRRDAASGSSPKPFFNERVEDLHGGGRDQRRGDGGKAAHHAAELESLLRLQQVFDSASQR